METMSMSRSENNTQGTDPNALVVFELQEESISELRRLLYEKNRDAQLAAEIGTALLQENNKLSNALHSKEAEIKALEEKVSNLESALDRQSHRYNVSSRLEQTLLHKEKSQDADSAAILSTSPLKQPPTFMQNNRMLQRLENKIAQLKADKLQLESRIQDFVTQLEKSEKSRWDTQDEMNKMKESYENIKHQMHMNQDSARTLRELVETQKEALEDAQRIDEENKKIIGKLKSDVLKFQQQLESSEGAQQEIKQLKQENSHLRKINSQQKRVEEEYQLLLSENERLSSLLKDRNDLTEGMQRLLEENKRYRREQEETSILLEDSKRTISELKDKVEELSIGRSNGESIAGLDLKISDMTVDALKTLEASSPRAPSRQNSLEFIASPQKSFPPVDIEKEEQKTTQRKLQRKLSTFQKRTQSLGRIPKLGEISEDVSESKESPSRILLEQKKNTIQYLSTRLSTSESMRVREEQYNKREELIYVPKSKEQALNDLNKRLDSSKDKLKKIRYSEKFSHSEKMRCPLWPSCDKGIHCLYHHPTEICKNFPNCPKGDACLDIHQDTSMCRYGIKCTKNDCGYKHPPGRVVTPKTWRMKSKSSLSALDT